MSDIKLATNEIRLEALRVTAFGPDLCLDYVERRSNKSALRRALVHDTGDRLTLNWGKDYPGGVRINGAVAVPESLAVASISSYEGDLDVHSFRTVLHGADLCLDDAKRRKNNSKYRRAFVHDVNDGLTLNWASDYPGGVTIVGAVNIPSKLAVDKLAALEGNNELELTAYRVKISGAQLCLDESSHRSNNSPYRRALVHNGDDGLTINWGLDYPGGVAISGNVEIPGLLAVHKLSTIGNGDQIEVHAERVKLAGGQFCVDEVNHRVNDTPYRRALVHNEKDGLTINWGLDYPGGVAIGGDVEVPGLLAVHKLSTVGKANEIEVAAFRLRQRGADLCLDYPPRRSNDTAYRRALVHDPGDGLTLNWANDYPGGMTLNGAVKIPQDLTVGVLKCAGVDVGDALQQVSAKTVAIQTQIDELIALVAKLQSEVDELKP